MAWLVFVTSLGWAEPPGDREFLEIVRDVHRANLAGVTSGDVPFQYATGECKDLNELSAGRWKDKAVAAGRFVFKDSLKRFDRISTLEDMNSRREWIDEMNYRTSLHLSLRVVTDGSSTFFDQVQPTIDGSELLHSAHVYPGDQSFNTHARMPLGLGGAGDHALNLAWDLELVLRDPPALSIESIDKDARLDGKPLLKIVVKIDSGTRTYWVDLERGATPDRVVVQSTRHRGFTVVFSDYRYVNNTTWYPFRELVFVDGGISRETAIGDKAAFGAVPPDSAFLLDFPNRVSVIDEVRMVRYPPKEAWSLKSLPSISSPGVQRLSFAESPTPVPKMPGERDRLRLAGWPAAVAIFSAVVAVSTAIVRKRFTRRVRT